MLKRATRPLYRAKRDGRNRVVAGRGLIALKPCRFVACGRRSPSLFAIYYTVSSLRTHLAGRAVV